MDNKYDAKEIEHIAWGKYVKTGNKKPEKKGKMQKLKETAKNFKENAKKVGEGFNKVSSQLLYDPKKADEFGGIGGIGLSGSDDMSKALFGPVDDDMLGLGSFGKIEIGI